MAKRVRPPSRPNEHIDSSSWDYRRSVGELRRMLDEVEERMAIWQKAYKEPGITRNQQMTCMRNYTALRGAAKSLRWALGDSDETPLY